MSLSIEIIDLDEYVESRDLAQGPENIDQDDSSIELIEEVSSAHIEPKCNKEIDHQGAKHIEKNFVDLSNQYLQKENQIFRSAINPLNDVSDEISFSYQNDTVLAARSSSIVQNSKILAQKQDKNNISHSRQLIINKIIGESSDEDSETDVFESLRNRNRVFGASLERNIEKKTYVIEDDLDILSQGSQKFDNELPSSPRNTSPKRVKFPRSNTIAQECSISDTSLNESDKRLLNNKNHKTQKKDSYVDTSHTYNRLKRSNTDVPILDLLETYEPEMKKMRPLSMTANPSLGNHLEKSSTNESENIFEKQGSVGGAVNIITYEYITNSRNYSLMESQELLKKYNKDPALKRKFTEANKVIRQKEELFEELIMDFNYQLFENMEQGGIDLKKDILCNVKKHFESTEPIIKFKRKVKSIYDIDHDIYYPCEDTVVEEPFLIIFYDSIDFFTKYKENKTHLIDLLKSFRKNYMRVIVILNQFQKLETSLKSMVNKKYVSEVRNNFSSSSTQHKTSKKENLLEGLNLRAEDMHFKATEIALLTDVHVFPMISHNNFVDWTKSIILNIARCRYESSLRNSSHSHLNVKSGQNPREVFEKSLEQFNLVTSVKSRRVSSTYPSFQSFFDNVRNVKKGPDGKNLISPSSLDAIKILFTSDDPDEFVYK